MDGGWGGRSSIVSPRGRKKREEAVDWRREEAFSGLHGGAPVRKKKKLRVHGQLKIEGRRGIYPFAFRGGEDREIFPPLLRGRREKGRNRRGASLSFK